MAKDYYGVLGVDKNANADEIKSAYRRLAKKYHPDVFSTAPQKEKQDAETKFKEVQHAYDVLSDPQKRAAFDKYGNEEGPQASDFSGFSGFSGGGGFGDIFSDIFSAFTGGGRESHQRAGDDIEVGLTLTFKEAYFGVEKEINYSRVERCGSCNGTGAKDGSSFKVCTKCGGRGRIVVSQRTMLGMMQTERVCDMCGGSGKIIVEQCPDCKGKARNKVQRRVKVKIPAGIDNNQMLTMKNEGSAGAPNTPNGNLIILIKVLSHQIFVRNGRDLHMEFPISIVDAILGASVEIPTMTGMVKVNIPEGTQDGTTIRVKGRGMKAIDRDVYGDLYVKVTLDVPKNLSGKSKKNFKEVIGDVLGDARYEKIEKYQKAIKDI